MYRRPKFLEILHEIREKMSREADYDMDLFAQMANQAPSQKSQPAGGGGSGSAARVEEPGNYGFKDKTSKRRLKPLNLRLGTKK